MRHAHLCVASIFHAHIHRAFPQIGVHVGRARISWQASGRPKTKRPITEPTADGNRRGDARLNSDGKLLTGLRFACQQDPLGARGLDTGVDPCLNGRGTTGEKKGQGKEGKVFHGHTIPCLAQAWQLTFVCVSANSQGLTRLDRTLKGYEPI